MGLRGVAVLVGLLLSFSVRAEVPARLEQLIAEEPELGSLSATLAGAVAAMPAARQAALAEEQRRWRDGMGEECIFAVEGDPVWRRRAEVQCLRNRLTRRIAYLRAEGARQQAAAMSIPGPDGDLCRAVMDSGNFTWTGRNGSSRGIFADRFTYVLPSSVREVRWDLLGRGNLVTVDTTRLDLDGDGRAELVFRVIGHRVIQPAFYVVAPPDEEALLKEAFLAVLNSGPAEQMPALTRLRDRLGGGREPVYLSSVLTDAMWNGWWIYTLASQQPADLSSEMLLIPDLAETRDDGPPLVKSTLLVQDGHPYVLAETGTGIAALFRPRRGEPMEMVCHHVAAASVVTPKAEILSDRYACPPLGGAPLADIPWDHYEPYPARTVLNLPEWGGARPLVRVQLKHGYIFPHVFVGALGASEVEPPARREDRPSDHWQPLFGAVAHDELDIRRASDGAYLVGRDYPQPRDRSLEPPSTYYRIAGNALVPVCRVEDRVTPPPGYRATP
jgi:hypothetical protein